MTSYQTLRLWLEGLDLKAYLLLALTALAIIALPVFGIFPHGSLQIANAFISGCCWSVCVGILIMGGQRIDLVTTAAAAFLAGGLTTSIPSIFYEHTPVDWGSTLSRLGVLLFVLRVAYDCYERIMREREK